VNKYGIIIDNKKIEASPKKMILVYLNISFCFCYLARPVYVGFTRLVSLTLCGFLVGLFNVGDCCLAGYDILLEWREHFKLRHPISNVIVAKLSSLPPSKIEYLCARLYYGFYCFVAATQRNFDGVICGVCGITGEVYLGDGNEKNCCSNQTVSFFFLLYKY